VQDVSIEYAEILNSVALGLQDNRQQRNSIIDQFGKEFLAGVQVFDRLGEFTLDGWLFDEMGCLVTRHESKAFVTPRWKWNENEKGFEYKWECSLNVAAVMVPAIDVIEGDWIEGGKEAILDFFISHFRHRHADIITIPPKVVFHSWKHELDGIEIRGIGWEKFTSHASILSVSIEHNWNFIDDIPALN
jgi:hypothetical protein